jgi:hypothetical protein
MPCHAMHPMQDLFLESFFHKYYNLICIPICTKFLFLEKVGVTEPARASGSPYYQTGANSPLQIWTRWFDMSFLGNPSGKPRWLDASPQGGA